MERNTVIAIALSALVLLGSMYLRNRMNPPQEQPAQATEQAPGPAAPSPAQQGIPEAVGEAPSGYEDIVTETEEKTVVITTGVAKITFTNRGGDVVSYELLEHRDGDHGIEMADNISRMNRAFSLAFGGAGTPIIDGLFSVTQNADTVRFSKPFSLRNAAGGESSFNLIKQYTFLPNDYMFKLDVIIEGGAGFFGLANGDYGYTLRTSPQIGPPFNLKVDRYERRIFMSYTGQKKKRATVNSGKTAEYKDSYVWTGVSGKYFEVAVAPARPEVMKTVVYSSVVETGGSSNSQLMLQRAPVSGSRATDTYYIYVGPLSEKILGRYDKTAENGWGLSGLNLAESMNSTGVLSWLEAILKWCMEMIYKVVPNWGLAIIVITILLKLLFYPLTRKSSVSSQKMQQLQPRVQEIQAKYKGNPQKTNEELQKLYQEVGYNPLSGCLPLLIQFPILIAMFNLFNNYFEFRGSMFIPGWIPDLSVGDSVYQLSWSLPVLGDHIRILPAIYVVTQLLTSKLMSTGSAGGAQGAQMKIMMYGMPIFFFFILYNAPSGLVIYWTVSNALQLVQQLFINTMMKKKQQEAAVTEKKPQQVFTKRKK